MRFGAKTALACGRSLCLYLRTPKGRHDFFDDVRALIVVFGSIALVMAFLKAMGKL